MLTDGISLIGASKAINLSIDSGPSLPTAGNNTGELFYLTAGTIGLYVYGTTAWERIGTGAGGGGGPANTDELPEGNTNLYFTRSNFDDEFARKDTDDLQEGATKKFWLQYRFENAFNEKTTDDLQEGTYNKYFDLPQFNTFFAAKNTDQLTEGPTNKYFSETQFNTFFGQKRTNDLLEHPTAQFFTQARARESLSVGTGLTYNQSTGVIAAVPESYDLALSIQGKPSALANVLNLVVVRPFSLPAGLTGSYAKALTAASGAPVFAIKKNGTQVGTITFNASVNGTFAMASAQSFIAGDMITITAPSTVNATLADIAIVLKAILA